MLSNRHPLRNWRSRVLKIAAVLSIGLASTSAVAYPICESLFSAVPPKSWFEKVDFAIVEATLKTGEIALIEELEHLGTTEGLARVTFADGTQAIWKPGQKNLAEVSGYNLAKRVGSRLIPPTVERTIAFQVGSLQYFVATSIDLRTLKKEARTRIWQMVPASQRAEREIFYFVFGNWDLHWGNVLVDDSLSIAQIDNFHIRSRLMVRYGELPFVRRMSLKEGHPLAQTTTRTQFPFDQAVLLAAPTFDELTRQLEPHANAKELARYVDYRREKETEDLTMRFALWDGAVWIQAIGFQNYGPRIPPVFPPAIVEAYRRLTFAHLREDLSPDFSDTQIFEMLARRDELLKQVEIANTMPTP